MANIFRVDLAGDKHRYCELDLPATDYELLDALEKLQMQPGDQPRWEICHSSNNTGHLQIYLNDCTIYELNAFARKLGSMSRDQRGAFEGMLQMALDKREGPMCVADLFTYANSTDSCHVLSDVGNDDQLGRFYACNDFIPELEDIPDFVFDRLDYVRIGKEMREGERGIFTHYGYVLQSGELCPDLSDHSVPPTKPEYTLRLLIGRYPFETGGEPEITTSLDLPASAETMVKALEKVGAASWEEVIFTVEDSAIPGFPEDLYGESFEELNDYAQTLKELQDSGDLLKAKALISTKPCSTIHEAMDMMEQLDHFNFEPRLHDPIEVAEQEIRDYMPANKVDALLKNVNLYNYGMEVIQEYGSKLTEYGLVTPDETQTLEQAECNAPQMMM